MKYRELLKKSNKLVEEIGKIKYLIALTILRKLNGKLSVSEVLSIVSTLTNEEVKLISKVCFYDNINECIIIETCPYRMASHLDLKQFNNSGCRGKFKENIQRVLLGKCEWGTAENDCDFDVDEKLAILEAFTCPDCIDNNHCLNIRARIYIYIPNGEYI